ncbi:MAG: hypothetical protein ACQESX_12335 [Bacteroidota bacterium]
MDCPMCGKILERIDRPVPGSSDSKRIFYCEHCGWGKKQLEEKESPPVQDNSVQSTDYSLSTWLKLGGLWVLSFVIVVVPYKLIITQIPSLLSGFDSALFDAQEVKFRLDEALNPNYWIVMAVYIGICGFFQPPDVDWNDMGWFGGLVNNPFSYSDDINRLKFWFFLLMIPGKIIVATITVTYRLIRTMI